MRLRTVCSLLALIAGTAGLCVEEEDVARICTAGTELATKLSQAEEVCSYQCEGQARCRKRSLDYTAVLGLERQSSHHCHTSDEIASLFQESLESKAGSLCRYCFSVL